MIAAQDNKEAFMIKSQKPQNAARAKPVKKRRAETRRLARAAVTSESTDDRGRVYRIA